MQTPTCRHKGWSRAQVNYCQGMAFVAGVILMYLPEEPAFRMLMTLMAESSANLRRLYTPGLEGLKAELRKFEWLMQRHYPALAAHLVVRGVCGACGTPQPPAAQRTGAKPAAKW